MIHSKAYKFTELILFFMVLPVSFLFEYPIAIKAGLVLLGFIYILFMLFRFTDTEFRIKKDIDWKQFWKSTAIKFLVIALVTTCYVYFIDSSLLFFVPLNNPLLYVAILGIYTVLSVWPQEVIYRTFFFERYSELFSNKNSILWLNAFVFSLAHIFFKNTLVLVLTFIGGLLFALTYMKTKSTTLVSIEHALYGNWLFTVGMGQMLAFPGIEQ